MFHTEITYHNLEPDPTTMFGLKALSVIAQYAEACQRQFHHYVYQCPPEQRAEHQRWARGPLVEAMDAAMSECRAIRTHRCEAQSKVTADGHAETILYCQPLGCAGWATVKFTTRIPVGA